MTSPIVLIPAYRPDTGLAQLVRELRVLCPEVDVLVVDDGSGPTYLAAFQEALAAGAHVHHEPVNRGKGNALKVGFALAIELGRPVVTADADGQHAAVDILRVSEEIGVEANHLVLGVRAFDTQVPLRSRFGNDVTRLLFRVTSGRWLQDTQTGLRGFPIDLLPWLTTLPGDRYEYELTMLTEAARAGLEFRTVPIATIYLDGNASSHFRPIVDSARIYGPMLAFLASSLTAFVVDTAALLIVNVVFGSLLLAVVAARLTSASTNFVINRHLVFDRKRQVPTRAAVRRYAVLATGLLAANYVLLSTFRVFGMPLLVAKILTEAGLAGVSFGCQARVVFNPVDVEGALAPDKTAATGVTTSGVKTPGGT